jgi:FdhE protein
MITQITMKKTFFLADPEKIRQRIEDDQKRHPQYGPFLLFWEQLLSLQSAFMAKHLGETVPIAEPLKRIKLTKGFPFFSFKSFPVDAPRFRDLFQEILKGIGAANPKMTEQNPLIEEWLAGEGRNLEPWLTLLFQEDGQPFIQAATACGLDPEILLFLFLAAWKPFLKSQALALAQDPDVDWAAWTKGYCPICGGMPLLAYLEEGGRRSGTCSVCEFSWSIPRFVCPYCESTEQQKFRYFFSEKEKGLRLEVCEACNHYWKIIDLREWTVEPFPVLDDLVTTHLDLWAKNKGYRRIPLSDRLVQ